VGSNSNNVSKHKAEINLPTINLPATTCAGGVRSFVCIFDQSFTSELSIWKITDHTAVTTHGYLIAFEEIPLIIAQAHYKLVYRNCQAKQ